MTKETQNEVFVLHYQGKIITPWIWKEFSKNYGHHGGLVGWRAPKYLYMKLGHAKCAIKHLPKIIQNQIEIVKYIPVASALNE